MGADFIFEKVAIESGKEQEIKERLLKEADKFVILELSDNIKIKILNSLEKEYSEEFIEFCEFWEDGLHKDFVDDYPTNEEIEDEIILTEEQARSYMKDVIEEFFDCIGGRRDISWFKHKGDMIYITGGMSWGDNPTGSFDIFIKFNLIPTKLLRLGGITI